MKLVHQHPHEKACHHACIAMLADVSLDAVIEAAGHDRQLDLTERERLYARFGLSIPNTAPAVTPYSDHGLTQLMRENESLLCSVGSWTDPNFAHSIVIHSCNLYDPWHGMNPTWPWHRVIWRALPVKRI